MKLDSIVLLALRNVRRQGARSVATLSAIAIGIAGLILAGGFVQDIFVQLGEAVIHSQTGHIQITRKGYAEGHRRDPEAYLIPNPQALRSEISGSSPRITRVTARLNFNGMLNNGRRDLGIIGEGIEPQENSDPGTYLRFSAGRQLTAHDDDAIIVGQGVATSLGLKIGDRVTLIITTSSGALNTLDFEVVGIFQSFAKEFDARIVRIPLGAAQKLADTNAAHVMVAMLDKTEATAPTVEILKNKLPGDEFDVTPWSSLSDFYEKTVQLYDRQFGVLRLITLLMVLLSVINSVNMTLFERTREFGTMRAIGNRSQVIFWLIVTENVWLGVIGCLLGIALGVALALIISAIGIPMPPTPNSNLGYVATIRLDAVSVVSAGAIGFIACVLASLIPASRASKLDISEALRHGI